ncbi:CHASE4 domain-containing protein [Pseudomonas aeruginosa]|nr:CHASE4 domain-containing protein [Pseudomonas aeruginosa]
MSESILLSRFDREDQQRLQEGATVLHNRLDFELKRHLDIVRTYAWWKASYDFIQRPNETFEQENLDHEMLDDLGFDFLVLFLDDRGHLQLKHGWSPPAPDQRVLFGAPSASVTFRPCSRTCSNVRHPPRRAGLSRTHRPQPERAAAGRQPADPAGQRAYQQQPG